MKLALLTVACIGGLSLTIQTTRAEGLPKFTGYTRPGALNEVPVPAEQPNKPAKLDPERTGLGATVYYRVYDLSEGVANDPWNTGIKDFANFFVAGKDSGGTHPSRKLDTTARYLYLYQTINDSHRVSDVRMTTVRLIVPPQLITSWGYLSEKTGNETRGVGFAAMVTDPDPAHKELADHIRLASTDNPIADRKTPYKNRSPAYLADKPYGLLPMAIGNDRILRVADNGLAEDVGRDPEQVLLINSATFDGPARHRPEEVIGGGLLDVGMMGMNGYNALCGCGPFGGFPGYNIGAWGGYNYPFVSRVYPPLLSPMLPLYNAAAPLYAPIAPVAAVAPGEAVAPGAGAIDGAGNIAPVGSAPIKAACPTS